MGRAPADRSRVTYSPHPDVPVGEQFNVLESIYALALKKAKEANRGGPETAPNDHKHNPVSSSSRGWGDDG